MTDGNETFVFFLLEIQWTWSEKIRHFSSTQIGLVVIINNFLGKQINTLDIKIKTEKLILKRNYSLTYPKWRSSVSAAIFFPL